MRALLPFLTVALALSMAGPAQAASAPGPAGAPGSGRIGTGWSSQAACINANNGRNWCRRQDCGRKSTGPCINNPKRVIWFYEPPKG